MSPGRPARRASLPAPRHRGGATSEPRLPRGGGEASSLSPRASEPSGATSGTAAVPDPRPAPEAAAGTAPGAGVLVVVPTYDEAPNVAPLARGVLEHLPGVHLLFVDDSSPDGTADAVREIARGTPPSEGRVELLSRPAKLGLGSAHRAGFEAALAGGYRVVVTMDADLSHDPRYLPELVAGTARSDVVVGSRYVEGGGVERWGLARRLLSRAANAYARALLAVPVRDVTSGFRAYRTEALARLPLGTIESSGYSFLEEMSWLTAASGLSVAEVPIVFVDRAGGRSKISSREILWAVWHVLRLRGRGAAYAAEAAPPGRRLTTTRSR